MQLNRFLPYIVALLLAVSTTLASPVASAQTPDGEPNSASTEKATPSSDVTARVAATVAGYVDSVATTVLTPTVSGSVENVVSGWAVNGLYLVDIVSAASPDIVSTASPPFKEVRQGGSLGGRYKPGNFGIAPSFTVSSSPDYLALSGSLQLTQDVNDKNLTLIEAYAYGHDVIGRTGTSFSTFSRTLDTHIASVGFSSVVNPSVVLGVFGDAIFENGDQSKPYRYIPMFTSANVAKIQPGATVDTIANLRREARPLEQLPLNRQRFAVTGKLAWRFTSSTLRAEERVYGDTWGLGASTTDVRYFVDMSERVTLWPHVRFHMQKAVNFWQRVYTLNDVHQIPAFRTSDRELGPLSNVGLGGGFRYALGKPGRVDDLVWTTTADGTWTHFSDTIYVQHRISVLVTTGLEVTF